MPKEAESNAPERTKTTVQKGGSREISPTKLAKELKDSGRHQHNKAPANPAAKKEG